MGSVMSATVQALSATAMAATREPASLPAKCQAPDSLVDGQHAKIGKQLLKQCAKRFLSLGPYESMQGE